MHGIVLMSLQKFVHENYDEEAWRAMHEEAGLEHRIYVPVREYPDEVVLGLVEAAAELTGEDASTLLCEYGRYVFPDLIEVYGTYVDRDWTGLDLIANVETYIHEALRSNRMSGVQPPEMHTERVDENRARVLYTSDRGLCGLAEGLLTGAAEYYDEDLAIEERQCAHHGADHCEFVVTAG